MKPPSVDIGDKYLSSVHCQLHLYSLVFNLSQMSIRVLTFRTKCMKTGCSITPIRLRGFEHFSLLQLTEGKLNALTSMLPYLCIIQVM